MNCPCCGAAELIHDTRHAPYIYKSDATTIPAVKGDFCPACGVVVLNKEQGDRYGEFIRQFQRQVNATYVDPSFSATVRKKLKLDQLEAAEMFGGGVNAFSRYEKGRAKPPLALVKLFWVLNRHPNLLKELKSIDDLGMGTSVTPQCYTKDKTLC